MRRHRLLAVAEARPKHDRADQAGNAGIDMDDGAAGEVDGALVEEPAIGGIHGVRIVGEDCCLGCVVGRGGELGEEVGGRSLADRGLDRVEVVGAQA